MKYARLLTATCLTAVLALCVISCGYSQEELDKAYQEGYDAGYNQNSYEAPVKRIPPIKSYQSSWQPPWMQEATQADENESEWQEQQQELEDQQMQLEREKEELEDQLQQAQFEKERLEQEALERDLQYWEEYYERQDLEDQLYRERQDAERQRQEQEDAEKLRLFYEK